jgi:hypothetical protein
MAREVPGFGQVEVIEIDKTAAIPSSKSMTRSRLPLRAPFASTSRQRKIRRLGSPAPWLSPRKMPKSFLHHQPKRSDGRRPARAYQNTRHAATTSSGTRPIATNSKGKGSLPCVSGLFMCCKRHREGRFPTVLAESDALVGTAGTHRSPTVAGFNRLDVVPSFAFPACGSAA